MFKCFISIIFFSMILNGFQDYYGSYKIYDTLLVDKNLKIRAAEFSIYDKAENNNQPKLIYSEKILGFHLGGFNWTITERNEVIKFLKFDGSMVPGSDCSLIKYKIEKDSLKQLDKLDLGYLDYNTKCDFSNLEAAIFTSDSIIKVDLEKFEVIE